MKRENRNETMKVLTADELRHVIGGTQDPSRPVEDPSDTRSGFDAVGQNYGR